MDEGGTPVRIRMCSAIAVDVGLGSPAQRTLSGRDLGSRKARTMLARLAAGRGALVSLDTIVDALWPGQPPADPAANVATLVSRARRLLGPGILATSGRSYGLEPGGRWTLDLDEAGRLCTEAESRLRSEPALAAAAARAAAELLGSRTALVDQDDADWVQQVRREAAGLRRRAALLLAQALTVASPSTAFDTAAGLVAADPLDEQAVRALMRAAVADGRTAAALTAYQELVVALRDELGADPTAESSALHLAILRESQLPAEPARSAGTGRPGLVGRQLELGRLEAAWAAAGSTSATPLILVEGEAGIGKTRLLEAVAEVAAGTGGRVLPARCHPAERSLFLQPYVDLVRPVLMHTSAPALAALVADHVAALVSLVPELGRVLPDGPALPADVDLQRRAAYDGVAAVLRRLALDRPVLLTLDDLQDAGAATVDLLGYLSTRLADANVLLVAAVRTEDALVVARLTGRATILRLGALPRSAVEELAAEAGLAGLAEQVMTRTSGHSLSVVEYLRALVDGDPGVPGSLADALLARVRRLDSPTRAVVDAGAVLGRRLDVGLLASLVEATELSTVRACEELVRRRLLVRVDERYEFANDLLRECVYAALAPALALAHHRRAADLTSDRPEVMAEHAYAAGDRPRAAHGWLLAGEAALRRAAVEDALALLDRSLAIGTAADGTRGRAFLARGVVHEGRADYTAALADIERALELARSSGDRRLEMAALRAEGGDPAVARRRPADQLAVPLEAGLRLAAELGDRAAEADFTTRLVVLDASRLRLAGALDRARRGVARARAAGSADALVPAIDGLKTALSYLGDPVPLRAAIEELTPLVRRTDDRWRLQWVVFESSFVAGAEDRWADARAVVAEALTINERSGYPAYAGYMRAHDAWYARLAGDLEAARRLGRSAADDTSPINHPWWYATAAGLLAATLLETGDHDEARSVARQGLAATDPAAPAAGRLRCLAALAALTDDPDHLTEAVRVLAGIDCPPGQAWVPGADAYLLTAKAALRRGEQDCAEKVLAPLRAATQHTWGAVRDRIDQISSSTR